MLAWTAACRLALTLFLAVGDVSGGMSISSPEFAQGQPMPAKYAMRSGDKSPQLLIGSVPVNATTLVLIVDDPDAPAGLWTHWLLWNIAAHQAVIDEGKVPEGAIQGTNSFGNARYDGPAPPSGTHRYFFHIYALDSNLTIDPGAPRDQVDAAMKGHVIGHAEFYGTYAAKP